jgi:hypothetical protein
MIIFIPVIIYIYIYIDSEPINYIVNEIIKGKTNVELRTTHGRLKLLFLICFFIILMCYIKNNF